MNESEDEFEVITINPNVNYESEDEAMEDLSHNSCVVVPDNKIQEPEHICNQEVEVKELAKVDQASCDNLGVTMDDDNSMSSNDSVKKVRKKLNLAEYKKRRANEKVENKPLFDVPRKIAAFELCDVPASLPLLILPTDPNWSQQMKIKNEPIELVRPSKTVFNPDVYEEIIMVSNGCNTDITIPPFDESEDTNDKKPGSKFLKNIVNNLKKDNVDNILNSSTSLFSSIQAVVQGKCVSTETNTEPRSTQSVDTNEQGEDKIIMHLRKDRLKPFKCSVGLQTEDMSLFPPLLLSPSLVFNRIRNSRNYRRKTSRSRSRSRSYSPSMDYDRVRYHNSSRYSKSQHSTHSSSMNSSDSSDSDSDSDASDYSSSRSSSDSLKRFNDRQNFRFYNRNQNQGYQNFKGKCPLVVCSIAMTLIVV